MRFPDSPRPIAEPLRAAAREVAELAGLSQEVQQTIARLADRGPQLDPQLLLEGQSADLLSQRLFGLAAFLGALADAAPAGVTLDIGEALTKLTLAEQARRLSDPPSAPPPRESAGEFVLFGD